MTYTCPRFFESRKFAENFSSPSSAVINLRKRIFDLWKKKTKMLSYLYLKDEKCMKLIIARGFFGQTAKAMCRSFVNITDKRTKTRKPT